MMDIVIDIETLPRKMTPSEAENIASIESKIAKGDFADFVDTSKWKTEATREKKVVELGPDAAQKALDAARDVVGKSGLNDLEGRLLCIGVAIDDAPVKVFYDEDADNTAQLLGDLETYLLTCAALRPNARWVGFNCKSFDLPWLWHSALKHGAYDLCRAIPKDKWGKNVVDLMEIWGGTNYRSYTKLDSICSFLGLESKEGMDGSKVYPYWQKGEHQMLRDYCENDVEITRQVHRVLKGAGI